MEQVKCWVVVIVVSLFRCVWYNYGAVTRRCRSSVHINSAASYFFANLSPSSSRGGTTQSCCRDAIDELFNCPRRVQCAIREAVFPACVCRWERREEGGWEGRDGQTMTVSFNA